MTATDTTPAPAAPAGDVVDDVAHIMDRTVSLAVVRLHATMDQSVRALCGAERTPRPRQGRPVCPECAEIAAAQRVTPVDWLLHDTDRPAAS